MSHRTAPTLEVSPTAMMTLSLTVLIATTMEMMAAQPKPAMAVIWLLWVIHAWFSQSECTVQLFKAILDACRKGGYAEWSSCPGFLVYSSEVSNRTRILNNTNIPVSSSVLILLLLRVYLVSALWCKVGQLPQVAVSTGGTSLPPETQLQRTLVLWARRR